MNKIEKEIVEIRKTIREQAKKHREDMMSLQNIYGVRPLSKVYGTK